MTARQREDYPVDPVADARDCIMSALVDEMDRRRERRRSGPRAVPGEVARLFLSGKAFRGDDPGAYVITWAALIGFLSCSSETRCAQG